MKEDVVPYKLILRFLENIELTSNYRKPARKIMHELRAHLCKYGDTAPEICEHNHQVLSLELTCGIIQDNYLDDFLEVVMKIHPVSLNG